MPEEPADSGLRLFSVLGFLLVVLAVLGLVVTDGLFTPAPLAIAVQLLSVGLLLWARLTFGLRSFHAAANPTAGGLVTTGPYRYLRHPIYAAILYAVWAGALARATPLHLGLALLATAGTAVRIACEERLVVKIYPEYREYSRATKRLIPGVF